MARQQVFPCSPAALGLIPEYTDDKGKRRKWEIVRNVSPTLESVDNLGFVRFLRGDESQVDGNEMCRRAMGLKANLGLDDLQLAWEYRERIPAEMQWINGSFVFAGAILRMPNRRLMIAYLDWVGTDWDGYWWRGGYWTWGWKGLSDRWLDCYKLAYRKTIAQSDKE